MCTLLACHWVPHSPSSTGIWGDSQVPSVLVWLPPQSLAKVASTPGLQILFQGDPLWPGKSAQQAWGELSCALLPQDPWPSSFSLPRGRSSERAKEGRMPARCGHCSQTESGSFLSTPENGTAQLAQEVWLLQGGSPECLSGLSPRTKGQPLCHQGTA